MGRRRCRYPDLLEAFLLPLARARIAAGLSQQDVASYVGVDQSAVSDWEGGITHPGVGHVALWAEAVGWSLQLTEDRGEVSSMARGSKTPEPHDSGEHKSRGKGQGAGGKIGNTDPNKRGLKTNIDNKKRENE